MKKHLATLLLLSLCLGLVCGCARPQEEEKTFRWVSGLKENCINPHNAAAAANYEVVDLIQVSLYRWAPADTRDRAILVPALADGEPKSVDGRVWTIGVNPDAKWQNGEAITAETFIYSWRMGLDPLLLYSYGEQVGKNFIEVEGAVDYFGQLGEGKTPIDWSNVGMKALDSHTLEIRTTQVYTATDVMRHFSARMTGPVYQPLYEAGMDADRTATNYGTELEYFMGCGPFVLTRWVKGAQRTFERNAHFIAADTVHLDGIECQVVTEANTRLELFEAGESDYVALEAAGVEKYLESPLMQSYDQKTIRTLEINRSHPHHPVLTDPDLRRAIYLAIDRQTLAQLTYTTPAPYFISTSAISFGDGTAYRQMASANSWLPQHAGYDPQAAGDLYRAVLARWGIDSLDLTMIYPGDDAESLRLLSEYLQNQLPQVLGAESLSITLQAMPKDAANKLMRSGVSDAWDLCWSGYHLLAESFEPHKKFAPYVTGDSRNFTAYDNAFLNENYPKLLTEDYRLDEQALFELTVEIERSIILDDVTCIPVVQERSFVLFSDRMVHCLDHYVPQLGFGWEYMDIAEKRN